MDGELNLLVVQVPELDKPASSDNNDKNIFRSLALRTKVKVETKIDYMVQLHPRCSTIRKGQWQYFQNWTSH